MVHGPFVIQVQEAIAGWLKCVDRLDAACGSAGHNNSNNNNLIYKVPVCRGTSEALVDGSNCAY